MAAPLLAPRRGRERGSRERRGHQSSDETDSDVAAAPDGGKPAASGKAAPAAELHRETAAAEEDEPEDAAPAPEDAESEDAESALSAADDTGDSGRPADAESSHPDSAADDIGEAGPAAETTGPGGRHDDDPASSKQVTVVPGVPRYHDEHCILIRFMADDDLQKMTVHEAAETGCTPCGACQPD